MAYLVVKIAITTILVVAVSEISRRSTLIGALLGVAVAAMVAAYLATVAFAQRFGVVL